MYDAIILAGGDATRLGGVDKPQLEVGGVRMLDLALAAVPSAGVVVIVGPQQTIDISSASVRWAREDPPGGGPVAAVAAAVAQTGADVVVVLAADQPFIAPAVPHLVAAVPRGGVARLVDPQGRVNHLAAAWDRTALVSGLAALSTPAGASMRALAADTPSVTVTDTVGWGQDCDTPADLARARDAHSSRSRP